MGNRPEESNTARVLRLFQPCLPQNTLETAVACGHNAALLTYPLSGRRGISRRGHPMARRRTTVESPRKAADSSPAERPHERLRLAFLLAAAFLSGAAIMILELAGNRILAPWFGNSLYTWTGLIGVVLISLSGGYYLGGYLADRWPRDAVLAHLLGGAAVLTVLVPVVQAGIAESVRAMDVVSGPVLAAILLLAAPGCLLAAVSPFAVRLVSLLSGDRKVGISAGAVSMACTLGSVLGTFGAGFLLIPHLHLRLIFFAIGAVLAALAAAAYGLSVDGFKQNKAVAATLLVLFGIAAAAGLAGPGLPPGIIHEQTSFYHRIRVIEAPDDAGELAQYLFLDNTCEGAQYVRAPAGKLPMLYQRSWQLSRVLTPDLKRAAFLGGGGFGMPEALLDAFPDAEADVLEIDPQVIDVGRRFFRVDRYPRMYPIAEDARRWLQWTDQTYDFIFGDAYHGVHSIPAHLATVEFFELVKARLSPSGVYAMNVRSPLEGDKATLFHVLRRTLQEVFPNVYVFALSPDQLGDVQNVIFVAAARDLGIEALAAKEGRRNDALGHIFLGYVPAGRLPVVEVAVLRDDYCPVEYLAAQNGAALRIDHGSFHASRSSRSCASMSSAERRRGALPKNSNIERVLGSPFSLISRRTINSAGASTSGSGSSGTNVWFAILPWMIRSLSIKQSLPMRQMRL